MLVTIQLTGCSKNKIELSTSTLIATVSYNDTIWEVYGSVEKPEVHILENGKYIETKKATQKYVPRELMSLPETNVYNELTKDKEITNYTYEATLIESVEYLNYLKTQGYKTELYAVTCDYIEYYMLRPNSKLYQRIIIIPGYIIDYTVDSLEFNIENYK